jgi:hypothetical protein
LAGFAGEHIQWLINTVVGVLEPGKPDFSIMPLGAPRWFPRRRSRPITVTCEFVGRVSHIRALRSGSIAVGCRATPRHEFASKTRFVSRTLTINRFHFPFDTINRHAPMWAPPSAGRGKAPRLSCERLKVLKITEMRNASAETALLPFADQPLVGNQGRFDSNFGRVGFLCYFLAVSRRLKTRNTAYPPAVKLRWIMTG